MHKILLVILLGCCLVVQPVFGAEDNQSEINENCDEDSTEACAEADDELDRGFDPCLINANLPACKSEESQEESTSTERASSDTDNSDDG